MIFFNKSLNQEQHLVNKQVLLLVYWFMCIKTKDALIVSLYRRHVYHHK